MRITGPNFLHWYDSAEDPSLPELPVAYLRDRNSCGHMPIALPTEAMSFYINTENGFDYEDFDNLRLALYRADNNSQVDSSLGPLANHPLEVGRYNIFSTFVIPPASYGIHYFTIYRNSTGEELLRSSYVLVRTDLVELYNTTSYLRFRNDRFLANVYYGDIPGFYQQFRLGLSLIDSQVEGEREIYQEVTTGKARSLQNYLSKSDKIESYYFDQNAHQAMALAAFHSFLEINGRRYTTKTAYKSSFNPLQKTHKGEFEAYDEQFNEVQRCQ